MTLHWFTLGFPELAIIIVIALFLFAPSGVKRLRGQNRRLRLDYLLIPTFLILWIVLARLGGLIN